ncbi:hypothetical protein [Mesobacillus maritimus]|uniref:DUF998 domain-containing protein n=1 Tax=Mesobacillus maritimus TaxID=1643336 RepID=A0ABS7K7V7_9BACI|nr:hypothetical protein [Mesobacillus maritimus]MBY0098205.1 hypothetical protein [Mesobacillus maritimus]
MKKLYAILCVIGGLLWGLKPGYDWLVIGREINTGYTPSHWTDYCKFLFPLLCVGGIMVLFNLYKKSIKASATILTISLILHTLFHFSEIYMLDSNIPFGLLFLFTGLITMVFGSIILCRQLKRIQSVPRSLAYSALLLMISTLLFCLLPFVSMSLDDSSEGPIMVFLMFLGGVSWSAIGVSLLSIVNSKSSNVQSGMQLDE